VTHDAPTPASKVEDRSELTNIEAIHLQNPFDAPRAEHPTPIESSCIKNPGD
jgi:hypothetical protein